MILEATIISLQIVCIHFLFQEGNLLSFIRVACANFFDEFLGWKVSKQVQKPLWDCMPCMASFWTMTLTVSFDLTLIMVVCGINIIINQIIQHGSEPEPEP